MIEKVIHQIFFNIGNAITAFPLYVNNKKKWIQWAKDNNYIYKFYTSVEAELLLTNEMKIFYNSLRFQWQKIDFCRYLILNKYGGIYIDLDIEPNNTNEKDFNKYIENSDYILNKWFNPKTNKWELNNALMGFPKNSFNELIKYSIEETIKRKNSETYKIWKIRYMLQTTGVRMFKRWCKIVGYTYSPDIHEYVIDHCTASWLKNFK